MGGKVLFPFLSNLHPRLRARSADLAPYQSQKIERLLKYDIITITKTISHMTSIDPVIQGGQRRVSGRSPGGPRGQDRVETVLGNPDLLRLIYGFGDATHRARMKEVFDEEGSNLSPVPKDYLPEFQERFKLFYRLVRCRCCSRHSHRKPWMKVREGILWCYKDYGARVPEDKNLHDCRCACRRQARQLQWDIQLGVTRHTLLAV